MRDMTHYRRCSGCGKVYHRVNTIDVWTLRMPGKRLGWIKQKVKLCNSCCSQKQAERMMTVAHVPIQQRTIVNLTGAPMVAKGSR